MYKSALLFSLIEKNLILIIQFISSIMLARLLSPEDFGVFAIITTFIFLAEAIQQVGIPNYILKEKELDTNKLSSAFALMLILGVLMAITLFLLADSLANFYDIPSLHNLAILMSVLLLISPYSVIERSLFRKHLNFKLIAKIDVFSTLLGSSISVYLAYKNVGVTSLALGLISQYIAAAILFYAASNQKVSLFSFSKNKVFEIFSFTYPLVGSSIVGQLGNSLPNLFIGKAYSQASLGQYARAEGTSNLFGSIFIQGIRPAVAPIFSKLNHENKGATEPLSKITNILCTLGWPIYFLVAFFSEEIVMLIYGAQWGFASNLVMWFCVSQSFLLLTAFYTDIMEGLGMSMPLLKVQLNNQIIKLISIIIAYFYQSDFIYFVATFLVIFAISRLVYMTAVSRMYFNYGWLELSKAIVSPIISTLLFTGPILLLMYQSNNMGGSSLAIITSLLTGLTGYLIYVLKFNHIFKDQINIILKR
ncbi:oligosaccharide flippase family protein [Endozoicomonas sp. G2_1]|uniref:oligosaccharide flippase family protein n=1 Tax=Endozoicomonas sp. G2_1 TaxID=2821091 RepID=UPI001ADCB37A|nr:oligosaccharide flippase family protein [Endozoicomonas sp. G2_1]MBO9490487.1 oligosaccharide flippase family protein [Endozoicomonas sp. G2_1]